MKAASAAAASQRQCDDHFVTINARYDNPYDDDFQGRSPAKK